MHVIVRNRFALHWLVAVLAAACARGQAEDLRTGERNADRQGPRGSGAVVVEPDRSAEQPSVRAERLGLGSAAAATAVLRGELSEAWIQEAGGDVGAGTLVLPVSRGWRVRGFGSGEEGYHKAIDIGGEVGWPAHAADDGIVVYAGEDIPGYGKIVTIVHKGRFATFYAHLSELSVSAGQRVKRGEAIGKVGSTGVSRGPHLHFELIHDRGNCDPEPLFRPSVPDVQGQPLDVEQAHWDGRGSPPAVVRCEQRPSGHPDSQ